MNDDTEKMPAYNGNRMRSIENKIDLLVDRHALLAVTVGRIESGMVTRVEMEASVKGCVPLDMYLQRTQNIDTHISTIEGKLGSYLTIEVMAPRLAATDNRITEMEKRPTASKEVLETQAIAIDNRLKAIENRPRSARDWAVALISVGTGCLGLFIAAASIIFSIIAFAATHH